MGEAGPEMNLLLLFYHGLELQVDGLFELELDAFETVRAGVARSRAALFQAASQ